MVIEAKIKFECKRCGKCCLDIPCIFAQVLYDITSQNKKRCPQLAKNGDGYKYLLIEKDAEVRKVLITGDCDDPTLAHLKKKFNALAVVKEYFPEISNKEAGNILWNYTGYPEFWDIPEDGAMIIYHTQKDMVIFVSSKEHKYGGS